MRCICPMCGELGSYQKDTRERKDGKTVYHRVFHSHKEENCWIGRRYAKIKVFRSDGSTDTIEVGNKEYGTVGPG